MLSSLIKSSKSFDLALYAVQASRLYIYFIMPTFARLACKEEFAITAVEIYENRWTTDCTNANPYWHCLNKLVKFSNKILKIGDILRQQRQDY